MIDRRVVAGKLRQPLQVASRRVLMIASRPAHRHRPARAARSPTPAARSRSRRRWRAARRRAAAQVEEQCVEDAHMAVRRPLARKGHELVEIERSARLRQHAPERDAVVQRRAHRPPAAGPSRGLRQPDGSPASRSSRAPRRSSRRFPHRSPSFRRAGGSLGSIRPPGTPSRSPAKTIALARSTISSFWRTVGTVAEHDQCGGRGSAARPESVSSVIGCSSGSLVGKDDRIMNAGARCCSWVQETCVNLST